MFAVRTPGGRRCPPSRPSRRGAFAALLAPALALAGCAAHPQSTLEPQSDYAQQVQDLFILTCVFAAFVFVVVAGLLLYAVLRYRGRPGDARPALLMGHRNLEIAWTAAPVIILLIIAVPTFRLIFSSGSPAPADAMQVTAIGHQWWFEFKYPEQGIVSPNELHLVVNRPVNIALQSADVMHSFWVPKLAGKRDMIPNHTNYLWFTPQQTATYYAECGEFCGIAHADMSFRVVVDTPEQFAAWVRDQQQVAQPATAQQQAGAKVFAQMTCNQCHSVGSQQAPGMGGVLGPNLSHVGSRLTLAAGVLPNNADSLHQWLSDPERVKPGNLMAKIVTPGMLSPQQISDLTAYLQSLK